MKFSTRAIRSGQEPDSATGAVIPPLFLTSTFVQPRPGELGEYEYTRAGNPNFTALEAQLAGIEDARHATVFSSGLGAESVLFAGLSQGDRVVVFGSYYGGTYRLLTTVMARLGLESAFVDGDDWEGLARALKGAAMLFLESPTNPMLEIVDIPRACELARSAGALSAVDNTFATAYLQQPLALGADASLYSTTKYIGGHSDVIGGAIVTNSQELKQQLDINRQSMGVNPSTH